MLNNLVLVGRVATKPEVRTFEDGNRVADFNLAVERPFKGQDGKPDCDFFKITVWQGYADIVYTYCGVGSVIGVKGRLTTRKVEADGKSRTQIDIIGERVAFIHTVRPNETEKEVTEELSEADLNEEALKENKKNTK